MCVCVYIYVYIYNNIILPITLLQLFWRKIWRNFIFDVFFLGAARVRTEYSKVDSAYWWNMIVCILREAACRARALEDGSNNLQRETINNIVRST
jgi:hypothetical protein